MEPKQHSGPESPLAGLLSASDLQHLVAQHEHDRAEMQAHTRSNLRESQLARMEMLRHRRDLTPDMIQRAVSRWQAAASEGATEVELIRFPSELCTDDGRAINNTEPGWPRTLVGVPAQIYEIWEQYLKPRGFRLKAYIVDFPEGKPGDAGLFLSWG